MSTPTCNHRLGDRTGLLCVLPADHKGNGHVYHASSGTWADSEPAGEDR